MNLARILIALYPRDVRARYGDEIAELLRESDAPTRDALDVAWHALTARGEHAMSVTLPRLLRATATAAALLVGLVAVKFAYDLVLIREMGQVNFGGPPTLLGVLSRALILCTTALAVVVAVIAGLRLGRRVRSAVLPIAFVLALAASHAAMSLVMIEYNWFVSTYFTAEGMRSAGREAGVWLVATVAAATVVRLLGRGGRSRAARVAAVLGGLGVLSVVSADVRLAIWQSQGVLPGGFPLWYPQDMLGLEVIRMSDGGVVVYGGAVMLTVLTALALAFAYAAAQSAASTAASEPVVPSGGEVAAPA